MAENEELEIDDGKKKGGGSKLIIIIAAALLGLSIGAASVFFLVGGDSAETEETANAEPEKVRSIYHRSALGWLLYGGNVCAVHEGREVEAA